jgi:hypothetical protein
MTYPNRNSLDDFSVRGAERCAASGSLEAWVHRYLTSGPWANVPLSQALKLKERFWLGPIDVRLDNIDRQCGPEPDMLYREPVEQWERRIETLRSSVADVLDLPPLIVNSVNGTLRNPSGTFRFVIADGTHRLEALKRIGRESFPVLIWFEATEQRDEYLQERLHHRAGPPVCRPGAP